MKYKQQHGGKRAGAGRPKGTIKTPRTKVMRVPEDMATKIYQWVHIEKLKLPLYTARVSAGFPSPADDYIENKLDLNERLITNPTSTFFVEVTGDSMLDAGIQPQDILVVDRSIAPEDGKIAIVFLNGEFTVKRLHYKNKQLVSLVAENKAYAPIPVSACDELDIWGIVTFVIHTCR